jgi:hypothetical protein
VDRVLQVIEILVAKLMSHRGAFRLASEKTALGDDNIIVIFGGEKGGKLMASKFGATGMNCTKPNLTEAFDVMSTMEEFDNYYNLKHGIFKHYKADLDLIFNVETDPHLFVMCDKAGLSLLVRSSEVAAPGNLIMSDHVEHMFKGRVQCDTWIRREYSLCVCVEDGQCWGIGVIAHGKATSAIDFSLHIKVDDLDNLAVCQFRLHCMLGGDIEFLLTILGHQSCSAHGSCFLCHTNLTCLRKECDTAPGQLRTRAETNKAVAIFQR